jgi:predicted GNAT family N-acyltransferase
MILIKKFTFENKSLRRKALAIRHKVFVIGQNCPEDLEYEFEEESTHFLLFEDEVPLATARHRKTEKGFKLERFAVLETARGKGYGMQILQAILHDLKDEIEVKYMHAQQQVIPFYEKVGFEKVGDLFEEAGIMHYKMKFSRD